MGREKHWPKIDLAEGGKTILTPENVYYLFFGSAYRPLIVYLPVLVPGAVILALCLIGVLHGWSFLDYVFFLFMPCLAASVFLPSCLAKFRLARALRTGRYGVSVESLLHKEIRSAARSGEYYLHFFRFDDTGHEVSLSVGRACYQAVPPGAKFYFFRQEDRPLALFWCSRYTLNDELRQRLWNPEAEEDR